MVRGGTNMNVPIARTRLSAAITGEDGLKGPTSVALSGTKLYVLSAALVLDAKPNILTATSRHDGPAAAFLPAGARPGRSPRTLVWARRQCPVVGHLRGP
jgi:hypothetical protein